jgi:hypothetical protein
LQIAGNGDALSSAALLAGVGDQPSWHDASATAHVILSQTPYTTDSFDVGSCAGPHHSSEG